MGTMRTKIRAAMLWLHDNPFIVDAFVGVMLLIVMRFLLPKEVCIALIRHDSWKLVVLTLIVLFRTPLVRILDELPGFLRRSYYRHGTDIRAPLPDAISVKGDELEAMEDGDRFVTLETSNATSVLEHNVFKALREEYGVEIHERMSIGSSHYYFDGVMEYGGRLYGIEIKGDVNHVQWERLFGNVQKAYDGFTDDQKRRFTLLVCIGGDVTAQDKAFLRDMFEKQKYTIISKFYIRRSK